MSQREKSGLSWPGFAVSAGKPFEVIPETAIAFVQSRATGVAHPATVLSAGVPFLFGGILPPVLSFARVVGQPASCAAIPNVRPKPFPLTPCALILARRASHFVSVSFCGPAFAVGHPEQPLSDVRRADARSAQIGGPDCISHAFHFRS
jgi:hypothetical protein